MACNEARHEAIPHGGKNSVQVWATELSCLKIRASKKKDIVKVYDYEDHEGLKTVSQLFVRLL